MSHLSHPKKCDILRHSRHLEHPISAVHGHFWPILARKLAECHLFYSCYLFAGVAQAAGPKSCRSSLGGTLRPGEAPPRILDGPSLVIRSRTAPIVPNPSSGFPYGVVKEPLSAVPISPATPPGALARRSATNAYRVRESCRWRGSGRTCRFLRGEYPARSSSIPAD